MGASQGLKEAVASKSETAGSVLESFDSLALNFGNIRISMLDAVVAFSIILLVIVAAWMLTRISGRALRRATRLDDTQRLLTQKISTIFIWAVAFLIGIDMLGIDLTAFAVFSGAFGLAIGFGSQTLVRDVNEVAEKMDGLLAKLDHPAMRDIQVDWPGVAEAYPARIPDLYQGEAVQVVARLDRIDGTATVRGLAPQPWARRLSLAGEKSVPAPGVARLWGRARIDALEDELRRGGDIESLRPAIVDVALRHGLVSSYTSLVAVDRTPARPTDEMLASTRLANATPAGSLAFAQGSTGWTRELLLALALALGGALLLRTRG